MLLHREARELVVLGDPLIGLGVVDQLDNVVGRLVRFLAELSTSGLLRRSDGRRSSNRLTVWRAFCAVRKWSVAKRVWLANWISFWRTSDCVRSRGSSPDALHRSTWKASVSQCEWLSNTHCSGVFEISPPSQ